MFSLTTFATIQSTFLVANLQQAPCFARLNFRRYLLCWHYQRFPWHQHNGGWESTATLEKSRFNQTQTTRLIGMCWTMAVTVSRLAGTGQTTLTCFPRYWSPRFDGVYQQCDTRPWQSLWRRRCDQRQLLSIINYYTSACIFPCGHILGFREPGNVVRNANCW